MASLAALSICVEDRAMLRLCWAGGCTPDWRRGTRGAPSSYKWVAKEEH